MGVADLTAFISSKQVATVPQTHLNRIAATLWQTAACRIKVPRDLQLLISDMCSRLNVDGLRGDLVVNRAVKALVAYEGRTNVSNSAVERVHLVCICCGLVVTRAVKALVAYEGRTNVSRHRCGAAARRVSPASCGAHWQGTILVMLWVRLLGVWLCIVCVRLVDNRRWWH
jgi:hypothetical protein